MFINASVVGTIALGSLGKIVNFSNKTVIHFHLFLFVKTKKCCHQEAERDWFLISGFSFNPAGVQALKNYITS